MVVFVDGSPCAGVTTLTDADVGCVMDPTKVITPLLPDLAACGDIEEACAVDDKRHATSSGMHTL